MKNEATRKSKALEDVRDKINNFLIFDFTSFAEEDKNRANQLLEDIRENLTVLRASVPNFKTLWHDVRYAAAMEIPTLFKDSLEALISSLTKIIPDKKARESAEQAKTLAYRINQFSHQLSNLLEDISDLKEENAKNLSPEVSCILQEISGLSDELKKTIDSRIPSK